MTDSTGDSLQNRQEQAKLFLRLAILIFILNIIPILTILYGGVIYEWAGSDVFNLALISFHIIGLLAIFCIILGYMQRKALLEEEDRLLLAKRKERTQVFETNDDYLFNAQRNLDKFLKYSPYVLLALMVLSIGGDLMDFWFHWGKYESELIPKDHTQAAFLSLLLGIIILFGGVFCIGQSRDKAFRWLRPLGAWLVFSFIILGLATFGTILHKFELPQWNLYLRNTVFGLLGFLGIELIINLVIEFYRPRTIEEERPVFESRLLSLFTEPGGVVKNVADTLDYQFGFKASRTWIYQFLERAIIPLMLIWLLALWLFTCIAEVGTGEIGIRERFGVIQEDQALTAGIYLKLPWPCEKITRFPIDQLLEVKVGSEMVDEKGKEHGKEVILWTESHYAKESRYLVATEKIPSQKSSATDEDKSQLAFLSEEVPVSYMAAFIPVQYKIRNIIQYAYQNQNSPTILKTVAEREVAKYLASADMLKVMSTQRGKLIKDLTVNIQKVADELKLGIEIIQVNLHDAHPPVEKVAPAFQEVVGAQEEMEADILQAKAYKAKTLPKAYAKKQTIIKEAESYRDSKEKISKAETERFRKQMIAYRTMPEMYTLRAYLDFLENDCESARKFIVPDSTRSDVYIINLEEKARLDLLDADLTDIKEAK